MAILCYDDTYVIRFTDSRKGTISIPKKALITDVLDIALVGKNRLDYGEVFDENMLHLLENFSAPELPSSNPVQPDISKTTNQLLSNPIEGQVWYNSSKKRHYCYNNSRWLPLGTNDDVAGNRGVISSGLQLPRPVSPITGYQFLYSECSWNVSAFNLPGEVDFMECYTNSNAVVTMRYRLVGDPTLRTGYVNYQIIGIKDNSNHGSITPIIPSGTQLPTPTPTPTPSITPSRNPTPSITPTRTRTPGPTPTVTPTPSLTPGIEFYVYASINDTNDSGTLAFGQVSPTSFNNIAQVTIDDYITGNFATDGLNLYVPFYNLGTSIFRRNSPTTLTNLGISDPNDSHTFKTLDCVFHNHPTAGRLLYTLQRNDSLPATARLKVFSINQINGTVGLLTSVNLIVNGYNDGITTDLSMSLCLHNNFLLVTTPETIYAYYYNGIGMNQISSYVLPVGKNIGAKSDGNYIFIESSYNDISQRLPRTILTFTGSGFNQALSQPNNGDIGLSLGGGYLFTGYNFETEIQAKLWDGSNLSGSISSVQSTMPKYRQLYTYSTVTNRLYNPVDNNALQSKIYTWNGTTFNELISFNPESNIANKYTGFSLMYLPSADGIIIPPEVS